MTMRVRWIKCDGCGVRLEEYEPDINYPSEILCEECEVFEEDRDARPVEDRPWGPPGHERY